MLRRYLLPFVCLISLLGFAGCGHYQLGTSGDLGFTTLKIAPVKMQALLPQAEPILSSHLRDAFIRDGRVQLITNATDAEATLLVVVDDYQREVATVRPGDTGLARKFIVTMTAKATLTDNRTGETLFQDRTLTVKRDVYTDSGQLQAEYQILPLLAQDLAAKATHAVLDTW